MSEKKKETGTGRERLGREDRIRVPPPPGTRGPPKINREKVRLLLEAQQYTKVEIARSLKCDESSIRNIEKELLESGELVYDEDKQADFMDTVAIDFDEECIRARGLSFYDWLKGSTVKYRNLFNTNRRWWKEILRSPSLVRMADQTSNFGAQKVQIWVKWANTDLKRRRRTKKQFRYLMRFLGRRDLCDLFLKLDDSRDPREVSKHPEISLPGFPIKVQNAIDEVEKVNYDMATALMFKLVSQMRTGLIAIYGQEGDDRGLYGMKKGGGTSYFIIEDGAFRSEVLEKRRTEWTISWIPKEVLRRMTDLYNRTDEGDYLFASKFTLRQWRKAWDDATEKHLGRKYKLHDTRKFGITWLYAMDIPLERAVEINAGWKDLNTPKRHYLEYDKLMKLSERVAYQKAIPEWFKDGLEEYSRQSQYIELIALLRKEGLLRNGASD